MVIKTLNHPLLLGLLVGLYAGSFYIGNNWFMFKPSLGLFIVGALSVITFVLLAVYYLALKILIPLFSSLHTVNRLHQFFVFGAFLTWAYLLRQTLSDFMPQHPTILLLIVSVLAVILGGCATQIQIFRINIILSVLCLASLFNGVFLFMSAERNQIDNVTDPTETQSLYRNIRFNSTPNIYYLVPDAYPNQEALQTIYQFDNSKFYQQLSSLGFTNYHSTYSNYVSTIPSIMATFGMKHHYYSKSYGNNEMFGARELISGKNNPLTTVLKNNGYQVHYIHQTDYLLKMGCFIDKCSPSIAMDDLMDFLVPVRIKKHLGFMMDRSLAGVQARLLKNIETISAAQEPHFVYAHLMKPGHSGKKDQSIQGLKDFRREFVQNTQEANTVLLTLLQRILQKDPQALIILNSDHGGFGTGWYGIAPNELFEGLNKQLTALDHMGVLLSIRWPQETLLAQETIPTNINLFRYVFAFLSGKNDILKTKVPDNSYLKMGSEEIFTVVEDGILLQSAPSFQP